MENYPLIQGAQYLLIGEGVDSGDTSGYAAATDAFEQLVLPPPMDRSPAQKAAALSAAAHLNAFFGTDVKGTPC